MIEITCWVETQNGTEIREIVSLSKDDLKKIAHNKMLEKYDQSAQIEVTNVSVTY